MVTATLGITMPVRRIVTELGLREMAGRGFGRGMLCSQLTEKALKSCTF